MAGVERDKAKFWHEPSGYLRLRGRGLLRISSFNAAGVRYLIVGSYAVMVHTELRYTKDLDL